MLQEENLNVEETEEVEGQENLDEGSAEESSSNLVEKDGELYLSVDAEDESKDPSSSPDDKELDKEGKDNLETSKDDTEDEEEPVDDAYKDKSVKDIIQMHKEATRKITEVSERVKGLEAQKKDDALTPAEIRDRMTAADIKKGYEDERAKLLALDPVIDEQEYIEQKGLIDALEADWMEKHQKELVDARFNAIDNQKFLDEQKEKFKDSGIEMENGEFDDLTKIGESYLENGRFTERSMQKALIDKYGVEKMTKFYTMKGEAKARKEIAKASSKEDKTIDVKGSGRNAKLVRINDLSERELNEVLDKMSPDELNELYRKYNR